MSREIPRMILFGPGIRAEASPEDFGTKAAVISQMASLGMPVPPGFSLSVGICEEYFQKGEVIPEDVPGLLREGLAFIEQATGLKYGGEHRPLLVSIRSGAPVSMPGMMDTILNVGLNRATLRGLIAMSGNPRFAWDTYRRFLEDFGKMILSDDAESYCQTLLSIQQRKRASDEDRPDFSSLREIAEEYERRNSRLNGQGNPADLNKQLELAVTAVLRSWNSSRAGKFREMNLIQSSRGTSVTIQAMVFGNTDFLSGAGIAFSRNPWTGANNILVDFRFGAQGEDVVSGEFGAASQQEFVSKIPQAARELQEIARKLESCYGDMQDIEFTVQEGKLFILQSRSGKRAPLAALRIAADLVKEEIITIPDALRLLNGIDMGAITIQQVLTQDPPLASGISASFGIASGKVALSPEMAVEMAKDSPVILVRETASPDDIVGISVSLGLLTIRGARTSHATVVARQMGKVCIVGCSALMIDLERRICKFPGHDVYEGEMITLDGQAGTVYEGVIGVRSEKPVDLISQIDRWREESKKNDDSDTLGGRYGENWGK